MSHSGIESASEHVGSGEPSIVDVTDKTFCVIGNSKQIKERLKEMGGKYSKKHQGYDFSHKKRQDVENFLSAEAKSKAKASDASKPTKKGKKASGGRSAPAKVSQEENITEHPVQHHEIEKEQGQMQQQDTTEQERHDLTEVPKGAGSEQKERESLSSKATLDKPYLVHYCTRNFAVIGTAEKFRAELEKAGCKHSNGIKIGHDKYAGWTFSNKQLEAVKAIITDITEITVDSGEGATLESTKSGESAASAVTGKRKAAAVAAGEESAQEA
jgi:hypothetical protein